MMYSKIVLWGRKIIIRSVVTPSIRAYRQQIGQAMVEYTVVLVFGVMVLTTGPGGDVMLDLLNVMKKNYEGYSFAISMSEAPDYDDVLSYETALASAGFEQEQIDKLTVPSVDVFGGLSPYNRDPLRQLTAGVSTIRNCISAIPTSANQLINNQVNCPP